MPTKAALRPSSFNETRNAQRRRASAAKLLEKWQQTMDLRSRLVDDVLKYICWRCKHYFTINLFSVRKTSCQECVPGMCVKESRCVCEWIFVCVCVRACVCVCVCVCADRYIDRCANTEKERGRERESERERERAHACMYAARVAATAACSASVATHTCLCSWAGCRHFEKLTPHEAKNCIHFSICACHPCAGAMLIFSVSFQF